MDLSEAERIREPAVAGRFYPADAKRLDQFVRQHLTQAADKEGRTIALIAPHAGYVYSGETAGLAFSQVAPASFRRVIILAPSHCGDYRGISAAPFDTYRTPLGDCPVDTALCQTLVDSDDLFIQCTSAHVREHSLEVQVPFIQRLLPGAGIVPLVCGRMTAEEIRQAAILLEPHWDENTLVVASSDFTHYGSGFGYLPFPVTQAAAGLRNLDMGAIDQILQKNATGFLDYCDRTGATICGRTPIAVLLNMLREREVEVRLINYTTSGAMSQDYSLSVSYAAISVEVAGGAASRFTASEQQTLLRIARDVITRKLEDEDYAFPDALPASFYHPGASFVSLHIEEALRGCMGSIESSDPLIDNIRRNAINAAFHDPRFGPLTRKELEQVHIEISCLTAPKPIKTIDEVIIGRHGIIFAKGNRRSVFLPQVAPQQGWTREDTLDHLALKAGLERTAWRAGDVRLKVFEAEVFGEPQG